MNKIISEKTDKINGCIFEISENQSNLQFPLNKVKEFLESHNFVFDKVESSTSVYVFYRNSKKSLVSKSAICFQELANGEKEKFSQKFNSFIISRSKIFIDSALQNRKAAKINLIQNQNRTCVSNMYYSLHNCFAGLIENFRTEKLTDEDLRNCFNNDEEENMLGHFTPSAFERFVNYYDIIICSEGEKIVMDSNLNSGKMKSYQNPFAWIYSLFSVQEKSDEQFMKLIDEMKTALKNINMENYGVDESQRRTSAEIQLKNCIYTLSAYFDEEGDKGSIAILACFLANSYLLRQSADYDSLFEIKIDFKDIINWTIIASNFVDLSLKILNYETIDTRSNIQRLDALSSKNTLNIFSGKESTSIMTQTGIVIDSSYNFEEIAKKLYFHYGYYLINLEGNIELVNGDRDYITLSRKIIGTKFITYVTISKQGLFRIDICIDTSRISEFDGDYNQYYLEKLIEKEIIQDNLISVMPQANIVIGIPNFKNKERTNYFEIITGVHENLRFSITQILRKQIDEIKTKIVIKDYYVFSTFSNNIDSFWFRHNYTRRKEEIKNSKILFIIFTLTEIETSKIERLEQQLQKLILINEFKIRVCLLSEKDFKKILRSDFEALTNYFEQIQKELTEKKTERNITEQEVLIDPFEEAENINHFEIQSIET